jgi:hypothetical protein
MIMSKAFWLDMLQHVIRTSSASTLAALGVGAVGTDGGVLPVTQVPFVGALLVGATSAIITILFGLTSIVIPGADPDTVSWTPKPKLEDEAPR